MQKKNYPALFFAQDYGSIFNVGDFKDSWYIPSFSEVGNLSNMVWSNNYESNIKFWRELKNTFSILNIDWPYEFWCSNSDRYENTYDYYWGGYFWKYLPKNIKFSRNRTSSWGEKGATPFLNSDNYEVVAVRKFY